MKKIFNYLQIDKYFTLFIGLLCYLLVIKSRMGAGQKISHIFLPDAPISLFVGAFIIMLLIKTTINYWSKKGGKVLETTKVYLKYFALSFVFYIVLSNLMGLLLAVIFDTFSRNFNIKTLLLNNISSSVNFLLFGCLYLSYLYTKENIKQRVLLSQQEKAMANSKVQQLKSQLNPHFLFNNLNTLDQLIEEDKEEASDFLNHFAELYRYALVTSEKKLVPLQDELDFVKGYFKLMEHKYKDCYRLEINQEKVFTAKFVPPFCLQLLVENAIDHNLGTLENPVYILIEINDVIQVKNNKLIPKHKKKSAGIALKNLSDQFLLLCGTVITIEESDVDFKVILPLINTNTNV